MASGFHLFYFISALKGAFTQIKCSSPLYIGGVPVYEQTKPSAGVIRPFTGTIQKVLSSIIMIYGYVVPQCIHLNVLFVIGI